MVQNPPANPNLPKKCDFLKRLTLQFFEIYSWFHFACFLNLKPYFDICFILQSKFSDTFSKRKTNQKNPFPQLPFPFFVAVFLSWLACLLLAGYRSKLIIHQLEISPPDKVNSLPEHNLVNLITGTSNHVKEIRFSGFLEANDTFFTDSKWVIVSFIQI